ncbi:MAG: hypothetical protein IJN10_09465 [Firmicutes bacterium]|nr:hypothetical protein [Bacillota bacterium]
MRKSVRWLSLLLAVIVVLGLGSRPVAAEEEDAKAEYKITSITSEDAQEQQYHWVILQSGRTNINQKEVDEINAQLKQRGLNASICFHVVQTPDYITPQVLEAVYEQLEGKMDFVSMSPSLTAFSKADWVYTFVDLTDALQKPEGKLNQFYQTVPPAAWQANQIADGFYSFSSSKVVEVNGFGFKEEGYQQLGEENLLKLEKANGIADEAVWKELYDLRGEAVVLWNRLTVGYGAGMQEYNYDRQKVSGLTNWWDRDLFAYLTDDIRYNLETQEFEWLGSSETYLQLKAKVLDFYNKGYIREIDTIKMREQDVSDTTAGWSWLSYSEESKNTEMFDFWVANGKLRVSKYRTSLKHVYSCVYKEAQGGWEDVLNVLGSDDVISGVLNKRYNMTISALIYGDLLMVGQQAPEQIDDPYAFIEELYTSAEPDPLQGFVFNPLPVAEEWKLCNATAYGLATAYNFTYHKSEMTEDGPVPVEHGVDLAAIDAYWSDYIQQMNDAQIEAVVDEVNRQYQEWQLPVSALEQETAEGAGGEAEESELSPELQEFLEKKEAKKKAQEEAQAPRRHFIVAMIGGIILIIVVMLIVKMRRSKAKQDGKEKTARVQIAIIDTSNGEAERNVRMTQGGQFTLSSSVARSTAEMAYLSLYMLDKRNRHLKLKLPAEYTKELNEGDIGVVTYVGDELLSFKKTGTITDEDKKRVKFKL